MFVDVQTVMDLRDIRVKVEIIISSSRRWNTDF